MWEDPGVRHGAPPARALPRRQVIQAPAILVALLFSKNVYSASLGSYCTFYLIDKFHLPVQTAQFYLFTFLAGIVVGAVAVGLAAGLFYGFSFGLGGLGAAALGKLADLTSITTVYRLCPFLLLLGLLTAFLPRRPGAPSMSRA